MRVQYVVLAGTERQPEGIDGGGDSRQRRQASYRHVGSQGLDRRGGEDGDGVACLAELDCEIVHVQLDPAQAWQVDIADECDSHAATACLRLATSHRARATPPTGISSR